MNRMVGTVSRGLRAPIFKEGDNVPEIVLDTIIKASKAEGFEIRNNDIVSITESVIARAQGNYATIEQIATDINNKFKGEEVGIVFPILSRNRFAVSLQGIAKGSKKVIIMLKYPSDEVGNELIDIKSLEKHNINPWIDVVTESQFREMFGSYKHPYTGVDYIEYYRNIVESEGKECEIILGNNAEDILKYTKNVLVSDVHTRKETKETVLKAGGKKVYGLDDILSEPIDGSGYNEEYGLLGSNTATKEKLKLFPRACQPVVEEIQKKVLESTGKKIEVMVYGDGAFKDPVAKIWELADPVVSPGYTEGLKGTPSETKLKYLADNNFKHLKGEELKQAISKFIKENEQKSLDDDESLGTTPRRYIDLLGSLSDLTSGSGDKGTPIVYIQGYFDNFTA